MPMLADTPDTYRLRLTKLNVFSGALAFESAEAPLRNATRTRHELLIFCIVKFRSLCGAKTRKGTACQSKLLLAGRRCKFHGGKSTGPSTPEGRAKAISVMLAGRFSEEGRLAHTALMRALWQDPHFRLRVARAKAARAAERDYAALRAVRFDLAALDQMTKWASRRRAERMARLAALAAKVQASSEPVNMDVE